MTACARCGHDPAATSPPRTSPTSGRAAALEEVRRRFGDASVPAEPQTAQERALARLRRLGVTPNTAN
ncbi:hypothetical protein [Actinoplanes teichomyceticus]|uniref:Uncharacterized protein n=1 Tax=Actinoplanes teichomyceticus TaxID=1867 RepID=A0A561WIF4_ACTTI|nr:hypothetical protein [Actinoplanes teichomyceticus]TWG23590.1 hypothetical protein FHX34_102139 [Actinoplanes teichomyceticus]GIF16217.1 hypothetical protein Ate01nite_62490 [Actinoplanes teichomyceticus]